MQYRYDVGLDDIAEFLLLEMRTRGRREHVLRWMAATWGALLICGVAAAAVQVLVGGWPIGRPGVPLLAGSLAGLLVALTFPFYARWRLARRARDVHTRLGNGGAARFVLEVGEDGFVNRGPAGDDRYSWDEVRGVLVTGSAAIVYVRPSGAIVVPRRSSSDDPGRFDRLVAALSSESLGDGAPGP